jgi:alkylation response protein AidB-like acyl-CoA dehydrogenase
MSSSSRTQVYKLTDEHDLLRETVRKLADQVIAPRASAIDETQEYPWDVHEALAAAGLLGAHVPAAYGGDEADAIAGAIVVEEVARVCASSSLILAVNKLGTQGMILSGSEELKQRYLPLVAKGEATFSFARGPRPTVSTMCSTGQRHG